MILTNKKIAVIGTGNIGSALVEALCSLLGPDRLAATDCIREKLDRVRKSCDTVLTGFDNAEASKWADVVLFCIKPQNALRVLKPIVGTLTPDKLLISTVAGLPIAKIKDVVGDPIPVIRAMPNVACRVKEGATAFAACDTCQQPQIALAEALFEAVGVVVQVAEAEMDVVTALSGSGPAYIYMVIEALVDGGIKMGLPRETAARLTEQTVLGAAKLVRDTQLHPAILRETVTTPGGVTISAIHELERHGLRSMLISAVETATRKSQEMSQLVNDMLKKS